MRQGLCDGMREGVEKRGYLTCKRLWTRESHPLRVNVRRSEQESGVQLSYAWGVKNRRISYARGSKQERGIWLLRRVKVFKQVRGIWSEYPKGSEQERGIC